MECAEPLQAMVRDSKWEPRLSRWRQCQVCKAMGAWRRCAGHRMRACREMPLVPEPPSTMHIGLELRQAEVSAERRVERVHSKT